MKIWIYTYDSGISGTSIDLYTTEAAAKDRFINDVLEGRDIDEDDQRNLELELANTHDIDAERDSLYDQAREAYGDEDEGRRDWYGYEEREVKPAATIIERTHDEPRTDHWTFRLPGEHEPNTGKFVGYKVALCEADENGQVEQLKGKYPEDETGVFWGVYGIHNENSVGIKCAEHIADRSTIDDALDVLVAIGVITRAQKVEVETAWIKK